MKRISVWASAGVVLLFSVFCLRAQESTMQNTAGESASGKDNSAAAPLAITGGGTTNFIPIWKTNTRLGNSTLFEKSSQVGIGTTTPGATLDVNGTASFRQAVTFASGQTFPGTAMLGPNMFTGTQTISSGDVAISNGNLDLPGTITSGTAGVINLGGSPFIHECCSVTFQNTFVGSNAGNFSLSSGDNTAIGYSALAAITSGANATAVGAFALNNNKTGAYNTAVGNSALLSNTTGSTNTALGVSALSANTDGSQNTAVGYFALGASGAVSTSFNTAIGTFALQEDTSGSWNTAIGINALICNSSGGNNTAIGGNAGASAAGCVTGNTTGSNNTFLGYDSGLATSTQLTNATAIGSYALVGASNALVLGSTAAQNGSANTLVGIDIGSPTNILTVSRGGGHAISDGWDVYSSRRWKSDIQPLQGALGKVQHLRGVSYTYTANGKHDIGMIAEEVGRVVPEVVSYEDNGKDARGIDYARLTALLVEAVKQQQREVQQQRTEIRHQQAQINRLKSELRVLQGTK